MTRHVVLDHDGGVDDFVALALLAASADVHLLGCVVTDADCFVEPAAEVSAKLLATLRQDTHCTLSHVVAVATSTLEAVHPFPTEWRRLAYNIRDFPVLNTKNADDWKEHLVTDTTGQEYLAKLVMDSAEPVTIISTGPLSNVAYAISKYGAKFAGNVKELVVMGGALDVKGNVHVDGDDRFARGSDNTQEFNFYWDAGAVKTVVQCPELEGKRVFFGLDATNCVPITSSFVQRFGKQDTVLSQFVGCAYAMTTHWMHAYARTYFAWDVLTVAWWLNPTVAEDVRDIAVHVEARVGHASEGRARRVAEGEEADGCVRFAFAPDASLFYDTVLKVTA